MPTIEEIIKRLNFFKDECVAAAIWTEGDVIGRAEYRGIKITKEQAQEILDLMDRKQDATIGITWDTIDYYVDECKEEGAE